VGTRVRIRGLDAGEVVALEAPSGDEDRVMVRLRIQGKYRHLIHKDATVQIVSVGMLGAKAIEIQPGTKGAPLADNDAVLATRPTTELTDVVEQVKTTLESVVDGKGTLGMLARDPEAYNSLVGLINQTKQTMVAFQQDAEAFKKVPLVGGLVEDPQALLVRPRYERNRKVFRESDLFEPGRAVLTAGGRERLNDLKGWLDGLKHSGSEVVVVSYADPKTTTDATHARTVTANQSKEVVEYLKKKFKVQKLGVVSWRKVVPLGMGVNPPPAAERESLPSPRVEIQVFVPQK
jgi:phospholipid/cholesterol/gamma-HCH transport system substrate-binding protein